MFCYLIMYTKKHRFTIRGKSCFIIGYSKMFNLDFRDVSNI